MRRNISELASRLTDAAPVENGFRHARMIQALAAGTGSSKVTAEPQGLLDMRLNPPSIFIFLVSILIAFVALISKFGAIGINIPRFLPHQEYWLAIIAYLVLMTGVIVRGL